MIEGEYFETYICETGPLEFKGGQRKLLLLPQTPSAIGDRQEGRHGSTYQHLFVVALHQTWQGDGKASSGRLTQTQRRT